MTQACLHYSIDNNQRLECEGTAPIGPISDKHARSHLGRRIPAKAWAAEILGPTGHFAHAADRLADVATTIDELPAAIPDQAAHVVQARHAVDVQDLLFMHQPSWKPSIWPSQRLSHSADIMYDAYVAKKPGAAAPQGRGVRTDGRQREARRRPIGPKQVKDRNASPPRGGLYGLSLWHRPPLRGPAGPPPWLHRGFDSDSVPPLRLRLADLGSVG